MSHLARRHIDEMVIQRSVMEAYCSFRSGQAVVVRQKDNTLLVQFHSSNTACNGKCWQFI